MLRDNQADNAANEQELRRVGGHHRAKKLN
jgi:hypothetical protein